MSIVRLEALKLFAEQLKTAVPELADVVKGGTLIERLVVTQNPPERALAFPTLAMIPAGFRLNRGQESEQDTVDGDGGGGNNLVVSVGTWELTLQLRLAHATPAGRHTIEESLFQAFCQRDGAAGVLTSQVVSCPDYSDFYASWELDDSEWNDEFAWSSQYWSTTTVTGTIPALVLRHGVYSMNELRFGLTTGPGMADASTAAPNLVSIAEDGTITPVTP